VYSLLVFVMRRNYQAAGLVPQPDRVVVLHVTPFFVDVWTASAPHIFPKLYPNSREVLDPSTKLVLYATFENAALGVPELSVLEWQHYFVPRFFSISFT